MRSLVLASALVVAVSACASGGTADQTTTTTAPAPVEVVRDVLYAPGLRADLYRAEGSEGKPTIIWIHGGGFTTGDKTQLATMAEDFARLGYPGMAIQYRLSEGGPWFPASSLEDPALKAATGKAVEDAERAVAWLSSDEANERGFGTDDVVLAGYSSGGIAAVSAGAAADGPPIAGAIGIAGAAIDPSTLDDHSPPVLLLHGDLDDVVPITLAKATCAAAARQAAECALETVVGAGHGLPFEQPAAVESSIQAFLVGLP
jgi:phospholipase/carboxylesterase